MPLEISLDCPYCGVTINWVYDEEKERVRQDLKGCPGAQCTWAFLLGVREISTERANEIQENQSPKVGDWKRERRQLSKRPHSR